MFRRLEMPARVSDYYCPVNLYLKKEVLCVPCLNLSISLHSRAKVEVTGPDSYRDELVPEIKWTASTEARKRKTLLSKASEGEG